MSSPFICPTVAYRGVSFLKRLTAGLLADLARPIVITKSGNQLAVLIPWDIFLKLQSEALNAASFRDALRKEARVS